MRPGRWRGRNPKPQTAYSGPAPLFATRMPRPPGIRRPGPLRNFRDRAAGWIIPARPPKAPASLAPAASGPGRGDAQAWGLKEGESLDFVAAEPAECSEGGTDVAETEHGWRPCPASGKDSAGFRVQGPGPVPEPAVRRGPGFSFWAGQPVSPGASDRKGAGPSSRKAATGVGSLAVPWAHVTRAANREEWHRLETADPVTPRPARPGGRVSRRCSPEPRDVV